MRSIVFIPLAVIVSAAPLSAQTWIGSWGASPSPQLPGIEEIHKEHLAFDNQTLREIVHLSVGGSSVRIRLSNAYGKEPVEIGAVRIARRQSSAAIAAATDHAVTFGGRSSVTIPSDALVLSDPIPLRVAPLSDLAISIFLPKAELGAGIHYGAHQTNYVAAGNQTSAADIPNASTLNSWIFLTGVDVAASPGASTLIAFGDSITDGSHSAQDANHRWPNFLANRLEKRSGARPIGVLNEGIGGNRILHDPNETIQFGVSALARFDRDVLVQPGVKYIIVLEGINDLGHAGPHHFPNEQVSAEDIIGGLKQMIARAHEKGIKIYGATLTPFRGSHPGYFSEAKETERKAVNHWIRTSRAFDGVVDFEKAVEDPANPDHLRPSYDSGDHLHPNDNGYQAMANAINLALFR